MNGIGSSISQASQQASHGVGDRMSVTVLRQTLDHAELEGRAAVSLIDSVGDATRGAGEARGAQATEPGLGARVDVQG